MVEIARDLCTDCGHCVEICPEGVYRREAAGVAVDPALAGECMGCGHCMAVCPTMAARVPGLTYEDFPPLPARPLPLGALEDILRSRRSVRHYRPDPVSRELLEQVVRLAATAPVGLPPTDVDVMVVTDAGLLRALAPAAFAQMRQLRQGLRLPLLGALLRRSIGRERVAEVERRFLPLVDAFEQRYRETGFDPITWGAPSLLLFHGPAHGLCTGENALIALTLAMIAADTLGLGTCVNGIIQNTLDRDRPLRERFGLPPAHRIYGAMNLGHPAGPTFQRAIPRAFRAVRWQ